MRIIYTQDLQRKEKKNTRRNEETFLRNVSFQMKNPRFFEIYFFRGWNDLRNQASSRSRQILWTHFTSLPSVNKRHFSLLPSSTMKHGTNRWRSTIEYSRVEGANINVSTAAKYLSSTFVSDEFFQKLNLWKKLINSRDSSSVIIGSLCVEISRVTSTGKEIDNR